MDRGRKRTENADDLPADKRPCSSSTNSDFHAGESSSSTSAPGEDLDMEPDHSSGSDEEDEEDAIYDSEGDASYLRRTADSREKFQRIVPFLDPGNDPDALVAVLTELCELLSFCTEESLNGFQMEKSVPALVKLAGMEGFPDVMLLAIRALTYLCDAMPRAADIVVRHGAVPVLCARLVAIEYMDLAEQCFQTLEKISKRKQDACLQAGVIMAVLTYIDFFSTSVQRVALSTVANVCSKLSDNHYTLAMEAVPNLCNLLKNEDRELVETAATCLIRITQCFSKSPGLLDELCEHSIIFQSVQLIAAEGRMALSQATYNGLIGLLTKLATMSIVAVRTLFELDIGHTLGCVLLAKLSHSTPYSLLEDGQSNQVCEIFKLLNQLIPSVARDDEDMELILKKEKFLLDKPEFLHQFSRNILPVSIQVVNSGANLYICYGSISIIYNIFYLSKSDMLLDLIRNTNISSFLAGFLAWKDCHVLLLTLKIIEILMQKLPGAFLSTFLKEGVIYAIDALSLPEDGMPQQSNGSQQSDSKGANKEDLECLCYAFTAQNLSSSETRTCTVGKEAVLSLAKHIKSSYFNIDSFGSDMGLTEILQKLKIVCAVLNNGVDSSLTNDNFSENEENLALILDQVMQELDGRDSMSTFEFIESGIVRSLVHYLSNGRYPIERHWNRNLSNEFLVMLKRFKILSHRVLSTVSQSWEDMLLFLLLQKLQSALSAFDNFPVFFSQGFKPRYAYANIPAACSTMNPCVKVCFVREEGEEELSNYNNVLAVELSSSLDAIEEFLWPKVSANKNDGQGLPGEGDQAKKVDADSRGNCNEDQLPQETNTNTEKEPQKSIPTFVEGLAKHKQKPLPDHSMTMLKDLTTKSISNFSSPVEGPAGGKMSISSPVSRDAQSKLVFSFSGKEIDSSLNMYQALLQGLVAAEPNVSLGTKFLTEVYKITYKRSQECSKHDSEMSIATAQSALPSGEHGLFWQTLPVLSDLLLLQPPGKLDCSIPSFDALFMLKVLEGFNRFSFHLLSYNRINAFAEGKIESLDDLKVVFSSVPGAEFISSKLTDKLEQQMQDPLTLAVGSLPSWCSQLMTACPFLFSFEARWKYFHLAPSHSAKNQQNRIQRSPDDIDSHSNRSSNSGLSTRKKFKVNRGNVLESAAKMMALHARGKALLEVEFSEEVGTGLGPTLEFYTIVSHEFQRIGLGMWREDEGSSDHEFIVTPIGLFPRPWSPSPHSPTGIRFTEVQKNFALLGQLIAKAIKDGRILDLPFSRAFYKIMLEQELSIYDIVSFDPDLGRTLIEFQALVSRKKFLESCSSIVSSKSDLCFRSMTIEDLCLDFILPGYPDYVLASHNNSKMVNIENLEEYVSFVVDATVRSGIARQVEAFKSGFNEVLPLKTIQIFTEDELDHVLCGERETWTISELQDHIKFDHGYTATSPPVISLLEIIQEFGHDQQRAFLQFVTGAPRLPTGGLAALNPKLTVVRKHSDNDPDMDLPSVMTCANYLKLPPYTSKEHMRQKLLYAITEGQCSFHLS